MKKLSLILSALALTILFAQSTFALGVTPLRSMLEANPGETIEGKINVINNSDSNSVAYLTKGDFLVDKKESLQFLTYDPENKYSLQNWIELIENDIPVKPGNDEIIKYKITVPKDATPQAYYGVIFIKEKQTNAQASNMVGVSASVGHLVLLEVKGDIEGNIEIEEFNVSEDDGIFELKTFNSGNTHDYLKGTIIITDEHSNIVTQIPLNADKYHVLPESPKIYKAQWVDYTNLKPGTYFATLNTTDKAGKIFTRKLKFELTEDKKLISKSANPTSPIVPFVVFWIVVIVALISNCPCNQKRK